MRISNIVKGVLPVKAMMIPEPPVKPKNKHVSDDMITIIKPMKRGILFLLEPRTAFARRSFLMNSVSDCVPSS